MSEYRFYLWHRDAPKYKRIKDPVGWESITKNIKRYGVDEQIGQKWHGVFFEYTTKIKFIKDGRDYVQFYYEKYGIEQDILLRIEKRNPFTRKFVFDYEGRLNLAGYKWSTLFVECGLESTGFLQKIKNRMDVKVDLNSLVSQGGVALPAGSIEENIPLHSKVFSLDYKVQRTEGLSISDTYPGGSGTRYVQMALASITDEVKNSYSYPDGFVVNPLESDFKYMIKFDAVSAGDDATFYAEFNMRARAVSIGITGGSDTIMVKLFVKHRALDGTITTFSTTPINTTFSTGTEFNSANQVVTLSGSITAKENEQLYLYWEFSHGSGGSNREQELYFDLDFGNYFEVNVQSKFAETNCDVVLPFEAFKRVLQSITDTVDPFRSSYLGRTDSTPDYDDDGIGSLRSVTSGKKIRLIDTSIFCSLRDLIDTFVATDGVGLGIERGADGVERVVVEALTYFYQAKRALQLNYVLDIEKDVLSDVYFNEIENGYDKWQNEKLSNLDEFNTNRNWTLPITQIKNKLSLKCPYITSGYSIEFTRRASIEPTKDTRYDDDNFIIQLVRDGGGFKPETDEDITADVISPETSYNYKLMPSRCLIRNGRLIRAALEKQKDQYVKFAFGGGNTDVESIGDDLTISENENILISSLPSPLFLGEAYSVRAKLTREQLAIITSTDSTEEQNAWCFIEFSKTDRNHSRGYVLDVRPDADSNEVVMRLIRANV